MTETPANDALTPDDVAALAALTRDLTPEGLASLLSGASVRTAARGEILLRRGEAGVAMGAVVRGALEVRVMDWSVALLEPGAIFGEMAIVLEGRRTADLRARDDGTRVAILRPTAVADLPTPADREALWRNLARILARRVAGLPPSA